MSKLIDKLMVRATHSGAVDRVRELLESGASINHLHKDGFMPLMRAAYKGNSEVVQFLLNRGADPNRTAADGASALFWSSLKGHEAIVKLLIAARANVNVARRNLEDKRSRGYSPIDAAISQGQLRIAKRLFRAGASFNRPYFPGNLCAYAVRHREMWLLPLLKKRCRRTIP
jgi:ankyrin repeat protein